MAKFPRIKALGLVKLLAKLRRRRERATVARALAAVQPEPPLKIKHNVLAVSDLHLGADLRAGKELARLKNGTTLDRQLAGFLDHYRTHLRGGLPWRLVLNGDIVDFVAITVRPDPGEQVAFTLSEEDLAFGLGAEEAKTVWKLHKVFERHSLFMDALARWVADGNSVVLVRGNHDADFRFEAVQRTFKELLADRAHPAGTPERAAFLERLEFCHWFYLDPGHLYVEHGHVYDEWCTTNDVLARGGRVEPVSSLVMRYFINRVVPDMPPDADEWGFFDYLRYFFRLGNPLAAGALYFSMMARVLGPTLRATLRLSRRAVAKAGSALVAGVDPNAEHFARLRAQLDRIAGSSADEATAELMRLLKRPASDSLFDMLQLFYLDQVALLCFGSAGAAAVALSGLPLFSKAIAWLSISAIFVALSTLLGSLRKLDAHPKLLTAARRVARLFRVRFVVMGHSHRPLAEAIEDGAQYFNLGSWTDAHRAPAGRAGFPHLLIADGVAELRRWGAPESETSAAPEGALVTA